MIATNAFGLGIDNPDIRYVLHYHVPAAVEEFYEEFGRAGRDGKPAQCVLLYDPEDRKLQRFFAAHRYPNDDDLVNTHHTLLRLASRTEPPTLAEIYAASPLPASRPKVCLALLTNRGIVRSERSRRYRLLLPDLTREEVARAGDAYRERREQDNIKQRQMTDYAEVCACRWTKALACFGSDEIADSQCDNCDMCEPERFH